MMSQEFPNWKDIRSLIAIKNSSASNIHMLTHKVAIATDPLHIFNDNFSLILEKAKANFQINHFKVFIII